MKQTSEQMLARIEGSLPQGWRLYTIKLPYLAVVHGIIIDKDARLVYRGTLTHLVKAVGSGTPER